MSGIGVRVRAAVVSDLAAIVELERATAEAPHWTEGGYNLIIDGNDGAVRRCLFVAETSGKLAGFAVGKVIVAGTVSLAELESVAVNAAMRRVGVGRTLCAAVIGWIKAQSAEEIELEVRAGSAGAIALYEGLGFVAVGRRPGYYQEPLEDALLMRLRLAEGE